jgi:hypothetical protein
MSKLERFVEYAAAFEETVIDDNWERLSQYFGADAVYLPGDGTEAVGREQVIQALHDSVNSLDRNFDSRVPGEGPAPTEKGNVITLIWNLTFGKKGLPDLTISGRELLTYNGDVIQRMEDIFDDGVGEVITNWMNKHGGSL